MATDPKTSTTAIRERPVFAIVVPCYNERDVLPQTHSILNSLLVDLVEAGKVSDDSFICYVDDGSRDDTWELISKIAHQHQHAEGLKLSRNFGHQNALLAGMLTLRHRVNCLVTIDADLQDDVGCISDMLTRYREGYHIVYGVRDNRESDTFMKRFTAELFYRIMNFMRVESIYNHADFRLIDQCVLTELSKFGEVNLFLRGVFPRIGFRSTTVSYGRKERTAGETKYPFRKMLAFAWEGITSFTGFPLRIIFFLGVLILILSFALSIWALIPAIEGRAIQGWASTVIPIFVFSGLQMISIGVLGEYLAKLYQEVKDRPRFIIEDAVNNIPQESEV